MALAARPLVPVAFTGDVPVVAGNVSAPSDDFNVMTARGKLAAEVEVAGTELHPAELAYVYAGHGGVTITTGDRIVRAEAGELIECRESEPICVEADAPAAVLAVRLRRVDGAAMPGK